MPWRGPAYEGELPTLGYQVLDFLSDNLPAPNNPDAEFVFTDEQVRYAVDWWAIDPDTGLFLYRRGALEMLKGWGKSPMLGAWSIGELTGPVLFGGWDARGGPVGRPWGSLDSPAPWVQIAAVSEDQTDNTYVAMYELLAANDAKAADNLGVDIGRTRLYLRNRPGRLEPVTAQSGSREGQPITFAVLDETHLWTPRTGGVKLAATLRRNAAKTGGRTFETTNAPVLGERSVAEATGNAAEANEPGVLFIARRPEVEPDPMWPDERLRAVVDEIKGDSVWVPVDRIISEVRDPAADWNDTIRYWFNWRVPGAGRAVDPRVWDARANPQGSPAKGTRIGLGFDGSVSRDCTVLRGCTAEGYSFIVQAWERPAGNAKWLVPRTEVDQAVERMFATYDVGLMLCDPPKWYSEIERWAQTYGEDTVLAFDTNQARRFAPAVDRWLVAIREGTHTHDADELTDRHVKAAHLRKVRVNADETDDRTLYVLVKGDTRQIDAAVADVLAHEAAATMPEAASGPMIAFSRR